MANGRMEKLVTWYERRIAPAAFLIGFTFDYLTLTRLDAIRDHVILIGHLVIAGTGIAMVNALAAGKLKGRLAKAVPWLAPFMIQFSLGGIFSNSVILYWRSGSLAASWPFLATLAFLLIGNEFFRGYYHRFLFHMSAYYIAITSYALLALPIVFRKMGPDIFIASGVASIIATVMFSLMLARISRELVVQHQKTLALLVGMIFMAFNILYFTNIIPPIPLVLKEFDMAHAIQRTDTGTYRVDVEPAPWYAWLPGFEPTLHWVSGTPIFAFSAVFAPTDISGRIAHHWLSYDPTRRKWIELAVIPFSVTGGRSQGYRGYTFKNAVEPGTWRLEVRTERGQLLGQTTFRVIEASNTPNLETREL